jgi:hypothetical protein
MINPHARGEMTTTSCRYRRWAISSFASAFLLGTLSSTYACARGRRPPRDYVSPQLPGDSLLLEQIRAAGPRTRFDTTRGDTRSLPLREQVRPPLRPVRASIHPAAVISGSLERGAVVARITSAGDYLKLGITVDTSYVWVDWVNGQRRELVVSAKPGGRAFWLRTANPKHPHDTNRSAMFVISDEDEYTCKRCPRDGWCTGSDTSASFRASLPAFRRGNP